MTPIMSFALRGFGVCCCCCCCFVLFCFVLFCFETESHVFQTGPQLSIVAEDDLELLTLLLPPPK